MTLRILLLISPIQIRQGGTDHRTQGQGVGKMGVIGRSMAKGVQLAVLGHQSRVEILLNISVMKIDRLTFLIVIPEIIQCQNDPQNINAVLGIISDM